MQLTSSLTPYGHMCPNRTICGCCLSGAIVLRFPVCFAFHNTLFVSSSAEIMSRCAAVCLILGLVAVGGASAATRQAYTPSAQALVREVVSTLKVRCYLCQPALTTPRLIITRLSLHDDAPPVLRRRVACFRGSLGTQC